MEFARTGGTAGKPAGTSRRGTSRRVPAAAGDKPEARNTPLLIGATSPRDQTTETLYRQPRERNHGETQRPVTGHRKPDARRSDAATPARAFSSGTRRSLAWATRPRREHAIKLWSERFMIHLTTRQKKRKRRPLPSLPHVRIIPLTADTPVLRDRAATRSHALMASSEPR